MLCFLDWCCCLGFVLCLVVVSWGCVLVGCIGMFCVECVFCSLCSVFGLVGCVG